MVEQNRTIVMVSHLLLVLSVLVFCLPLWYAFVGSTRTSGEMLAGTLPLYPGGNFVANYHEALNSGISGAASPPVSRMLFNSLVMALGIALGKILISTLSAFAIVFFRFPFRWFFFWLIFITLMLPVEVRIVPTYEVMAKLQLIDTHTGLILPLIASATATFLFRQFYLTVPDELVEAAKMDGATPLRFFKDILLPLSRNNMAAIFVIMFLYGWNQYLWPLLVTASEENYTVVMGLQRMVTASAEEPQWHLVMAATMLALLPPVVVIVGMQKLFVRGLIEREK